MDLIQFNCLKWRQKSKGQWQVKTQLMRLTDGATFASSAGLNNSVWKCRCFTQPESVNRSERGEKIVLFQETFLSYFIRLSWTIFPLSTASASAALSRTSTLAKTAAVNWLFVCLHQQQTTILCTRDMHIFEAAYSKAGFCFSLI